MNREAQLMRLRDTSCIWDMLVIGGGATGAGVAVDAAARGYSVCLAERADFGSGTSSRSTKLIHGGVRYLRQGNVGLVREALRERGILRGNAPHLVQELGFVIPGYAWWQAPYYATGLQLYDLLARGSGFRGSRLLSRSGALQHAPSLKTAGLRGGVLYHDGQFDDARLLIALARTAVDLGACLVNYVPVVGLRKDQRGRITGAIIRDEEGGDEFEVRARVVVNAAGPYIDQVRSLDEPSGGPVLAPSQGVHLVFDRSFLPGDAAIVVPQTRDGRVMFAIPWQGSMLAGTTDTPVEAVSAEPRAREDEIVMLLETVSRYLERAPVQSDIRSVFTGIRPLVRQGGGGPTAALSREHSVFVARSGLVSIAGGKWTTYRVMARDCVDEAAKVGSLPARPSTTTRLRLHGYAASPMLPEFAPYGSDADDVATLVQATPGWMGASPRPGEVVWAVRHEMARTVEDVLARRTRLLFRDARAAVALAPDVASVMARELGRDKAWQQSQVRAFEVLADTYLIRPAPVGDSGIGR